MYGMVTKLRLSRLDPAERRADIMAKASELFLEEGFAATSMSRIARAVGGSKATLYKYFPTKESLFEAMMEARVQVVLGRLGDADLPRDDPAAYLQAVGERLLGSIYAPEPIAMHRVVIGDGFRSPDMARAFFRIGPDRARQMITDQIARFHAQGLLHCPDAAVAAEDFAALLRGDTHVRAVCGERPVPGEAEIAVHVARVVDMVMRLWTPQG